MYSFYTKNNNKYVKLTENKAKQQNTEDLVNTFISLDNSYIVFDGGMGKPSWLLKPETIGKYTIIQLDTENLTVKTIYSKNKRYIDTLLCSLYWKKIKSWTKLPIRKKYTQWKVSSIIKFDGFKNMSISAKNIWFIKLVADKIYKWYEYSDWRMLRLIDDINANIKIKDIDIWDRDVIYNEEHNYLIDMQEDPKKNVSGKPYWVLAGLFDNSQKKILDFVHEKYWLDIDVFDVVELEVISVWDNTTIVFTNKDVKLTGYNKDWWIYSKTIFKEPILPIGITETDFDLYQKKIMDSKDVFYILDNIKKWEHITIGIEVDRKSFNKRYMKHNISFRGSDIDLQDFYKALDIMNDAQKLKKFNVVYQNWYIHKKWLFIHWWEIKKSNKDETNYICKAAEYPLVCNKNKLTIKEAYNDMKTTYNSDLVNVAFVWMLGAMCRDIFSELWQPLPFLLVTGETRSGKTNLISLLMWLFEFDRQKEARTLNIEWLTPYPISVAGREKIPLYLDEFTGHVRDWIEATIRWFYDEKVIEKWRLTGVEKMPQLSPLIISWERMPNWTSVINRSVFMVTREEYKTGSYDMINKLKESSIIDDRWSYVKDLDDKAVFDIIMKFKKWDKIANYADRVNENYCMIMAINEIFWLIDEKKLLKSCKTLSKVHKKFLNATNEINIVVCELMVANIYNNTILWTHLDDNLTIGLSTAVYKHRELNTRILIEIADKFGIWDSGDITNIVLDLKKIQDYWWKALYNAVMSTLKSVRWDRAVQDYLGSKWIYRDWHNEFF